MPGFSINLHTPDLHGVFPHTVLRTRLSILHIPNQGIEAIAVIRFMNSNINCLAVALYRNTALLEVGTLQ